MNDELEALYHELSEHHNTRLHEVLSNYAMDFGANCVTSFDGSKFITTITCTSSFAKRSIPSLVEFCHNIIEPDDDVKDYGLYLTVETVNERIVADVNNASYHHVSLHVINYENRVMNRVHVAKDGLKEVRMTRDDFNSCKRIRLIVISEAKF